MKESTISMVGIFFVRARGERQVSAQRPGPNPDEELVDVDYPGTRDLPSYIDHAVR